MPVWLWDLVIRIPVARWQKFCGSDAYIAQVMSPVEFRQYL